MVTMPLALRTMKHCVLAGLLALAVGACAARQSGWASDTIQITADRVQVVSNALENRTQLMLARTHNTAAN